MKNLEMTKPRPITFHGGIHPPVQWFKSIALFLMVNSESMEYTIPTSDILIWLKKYDKWYKDTIEAPSGKRLNLLYHRDLSVIGSDLLVAGEELIRISAVAKECGIGFSFTGSIDHVLAHEYEAKKLILAPGVTTIGLSAPMDLRDFDLERAESLINDILEQEIQLAFIGPVEYFRRKGLMKNAMVNGHNLTLHPQQYSPYESLPTPEKPILPCFSRFRIYIDTDGEIYPCLGLVGIKSGSLGSIYDDIDNTVLGGKETILNIEKLSIHGPNLTTANKAERQTGLPWICEQHRQEIIASEQQIM